MSDHRDPMRGEEHVLVVEGVSKRFGSTLAVDDASLYVGRGELIGIAGHNGAGKSTILKIANGTIPGDVGTVTIDGAHRAATTTLAHPERLGVRTVHQELSLCPSLRADETAGVFDRSATGFGWRRRSWDALAAVLDEMFPGHGIRRDARIRDLSIARRQMLECGAAMVEGAILPTLVILDEPTSSLDAGATESFYAYLRKRAATGLSAIITTHRLVEMVQNLARIYVMRDGRVVSEQSAREASKESLVAAMELAGKPRTDRNADTLSDLAAIASEEASASGAPARGAAVVRIEQPTAEDGLASLELHAGEMIGLAGLEGHGQVDALEAMLRAAPRTAGKSKRARRTRHQAISVTSNASYVSGDRVVRGVFPQWDVGRNLTFASLGKVTAVGVIRAVAQRRLIDRWWKALDIKGRPTDPILSLSGGTQQKALLARAMAVGAGLLLLEDPTRGVDQATKNDVYKMLRTEANAGQCVVWYSTENEELRNCDRVLVFQGGKIVASLEGVEATDLHILEHSFASDTASTTRAGEAS